MKDLVKICGLANEEDVNATLEAGPDALGFILWPKSPRGVTALQVKSWTKGNTSTVRKVGVFVDHSVEEIARDVEEAGLDVVQLHGPYTAEQIQCIQAPVWRVLHVDRLPKDWNEVPVEALLVDSGTVEMPGGTGHRVNTDAAIKVVRESNFPVILAGGLKAGTVTDSIREVSPGGVDVSSGVETYPGKKDMQAVREFIEQSRKAFKDLQLL